MSIRISPGKKWKHCAWQPDNKNFFGLRMSLFSRLNKISWIADIFTPLAVILMECFWLYPWLVFIGKLPELQVQKTPLCLLSLIFLLGLSFIATRFFLKRKWPMPWIQISIMVGGLAAIFLVLRLNYGAGFQLFSSQWFISYGQVLLHLFSQIHPFGFAIMAVLYLWWRGISLGRSRLYFENIYTSFLVQLTTLVLLVILWSFSFKSEAIQTLTSDIGIYIAGFFFFGLVALAVANLKIVQERIKTKGESSKNFGRRWLTIILSVIGGMVLLGIGFASVFSTQWVTSLRRLLNIITDAYAKFVEVLLYGVGFLVQLITYIYLWIWSLFNHKKPELPNNPFDIVPNPNAKDNTAGAMPPWVLLTIKWTIFILVVVVILFLIIRTIRRSRSTKEEDLEEEQESIWSWGGFKSDVITFFKMILQRFQRKAKLVPVNDAIKWQPEEDVKRRLSIREIYQHLLWQGARLRIPRETYETPSEYAGRLAHFAPDSIEPLQEITSLYLDVRYGEDQIEDKKTDEANTVWEKLLNLLKGHEGQ
jgi:uncharacterized membrane protein